MRTLPLIGAMAGSLSPCGPGRMPCALYKALAAWGGVHVGDWTPAWPNGRLPPPGGGFRRLHSGAGSTYSSSQPPTAGALTTQRAGTFLPARMRPHAWPAGGAQYRLMGRIDPAKPRRRDLRKLLAQVARVGRGVEPAGELGQLSSPLHCTVPWSPRGGLP